MQKVALGLEVGLIDLKKVEIVPDSGENVLKNRM
jgi:hypothetical protein